MGNNVKKKERINLSVTILEIILWNLRLPYAQTIIKPNAFTITCTQGKIATDDLIYSQNFTGNSENLATVKLNQSRLLYCCEFDKNWKSRTVILIFSPSFSIKICLVVLDILYAHRRTEKKPQHAFLRRGSKAVGPMS
jgi:hypothetical protein